METSAETNINLAHRLISTGRDKTKAEDFARRHGIPRAYDNVDALLADPEINAVYIATPPGSHLEIALKVAAAGYPLYVEKPAARSAKECEITPATVQGLENNWKHFKRTAVLRSDHRPAFFSPCENSSNTQRGR